MRRVIEVLQRIADWVMDILTWVIAEISERFGIDTVTSVRYTYRDCWGFVIAFLMALFIYSPIWFAVFGGLFLSIFFEVMAYLLGYGYRARGIAHGVLGVVFFVVVRTLGG